jgi:hypothetical protein
MPTTGTLKRRTSASPWTLAVVSALPAAPNDPPSPLEVLETDTLLGLLALGVLPLVATELASPTAASRCSAAALLASVALSGAQEAAAVVECSPLRGQMRSALMLGARPAIDVSSSCLAASLCCHHHGCLYSCVCLQRTGLALSGSA